MDEPNDLLKVLKNAIIPGGIILNHLQDSIENIPKKSDLPDSKADATSTAHTIADDLVQEVVLEVLHSLMPNLRINAEEETPRTEVFTGDSGDLCFHLDPLDGTYSYTQGRKDHAVGAAFSRNRQFIASAIYFPAIDRIYLAGRGNGIRVETSMGRSLEFERRDEPDGFYSQKRAEKYLSVVQQMGLVKFDSMGAHHGMVAVAEGRLSVLMYHLASPHDFGIPQVIVEEAGGICTDLNGNPVQYSDDFARVPWFFAFSHPHVKDEFFTVLESGLTS
ncbi:MAG: inositol monophosphatase family protein [Candidatus Thorarchaeota archaeon]